MKKKIFQFEFDVYDSIDELSLADKFLLENARQATALAHAPYSNFRVGAAARMSNGMLVKGANQENASFPAGLCAEGVVMASASALYPGMGIETMAISYQPPFGPADHPIAPCGICRQSFQEFSNRTGASIRLILGGMNGQVYLLPDAGALLPLAFSKDELTS